MWLFHWVRKGQNQKGRLWVYEIPIFEVILCDPHWELICPNKLHPETLEISTILIIALGTHCYVWHRIKTNLVFLLLYVDGEAFWSPLLSLVSFLSGGTVPPENVYSVSSMWQGRSDNAKKDKYQHWSQLPPSFISRSWFTDLIVQLQF